MQLDENFRYFFSVIETFQQNGTRDQTKKKILLSITRAKTARWNQNKGNEITLDEIQRSTLNRCRCSETKREEKTNISLIMILSFIYIHGVLLLLFWFLCTSRRSWEVWSLSGKKCDMDNNYSSHCIIISIAIYIFYNWKPLNFHFPCLLCALFTLVSDNSNNSWRDCKLLIVGLIAVAKQINRKLRIDRL